MNSLKRRELKRYRLDLKSRRIRKRLRYLNTMKSLGRLGQTLTQEELLNPKVLKSLGI